MHEDQSDNRQDQQDQQDNWKDLEDGKTIESGKTGKTWQDVQQDQQDNRQDLQDNQQNWQDNRQDLKDIYFGLQVLQNDQQDHPESPRGKLGSCLDFMEQNAAWQKNSSMKTWKITRVYPNRSPCVGWAGRKKCTQQSQEWTTSQVR